MARNLEILVKLEYIKNVLYFAVTRVGKVPKSTSSTHYFSVDDDLVYENYYSDFGPLNLACIYKYCKTLKSKLDELLNRQVIVHCTSCDPKKKTNAAFLLGCYGILYLSLSPRDAFKPLIAQSQYYRAFRDATQGDPIYTISVLDCLMAVKRARELKFFNFSDFDFDEYVRLDTIRGGDRNWIVPGKFLAFTGPEENSPYSHYPPQKYIEYFKMNNVRAVVQLNEKHYDESIFENAGIAHYTLYFPDGSCPSRNIVFKFLQISEDTKGALAVHCKAGLGRTGTLIGCYIIKHYRMTAHEAIAWMRICRPGSVIGHQQGWLEQCEKWLMRLGNLKRNQNYYNIQPTHRYGIYSVAEKSVRMQEDVMRRIVSPHLRRRLLEDLSPRRTIPVETRDVRGSSRGREGEKSNSSPYVSKINLTLRRQSKGDATEVSSGHSSRRSNGIVIPKPVIVHSTSPATIVKDEGTMTLSERKMKNKYDKFTTDSHKYGFHPIPVYCEDQNRITKLTNDVTKLSIKPILAEDRRKPLMEYTVKSVSPPNNYSNLSRLSAPRNPRPTRRLLGRSPSPPPRSPARAGDLLASGARATNTTSAKLVSTSTILLLRAALSSPKSPSPHVFDASSLGAASLGAREPPGRARMPSVRSDNRPTATQGDLLNGIKLARRIKENLQSEKINNLLTKERLIIPLENPASKKVIPRTSVIITSNTQDRPITTVHARPHSPSRRARQLDTK